MKLGRNRLNRIVLYAIATCLFDVGITYAAPAAPHAAAAPSAAPSAAPAAPAQSSAAHAAPAETARPAEPVRPALPSHPDTPNPSTPDRVTPSPMPHGDGKDRADRDRQSNPSNSAGYYGYPLGYAYNYWDPNWNAYSNYNGPTYPGQFNQADTATAAPDHTPPDAVIPAPSVPDTATPAISSALMASPQWRDADAQVRIAQAAYDAAAARVIDQLKTQPDYQSAVARKEQDTKKVDQLKAKDPAPTVERAAPAATAKLDAAKSVTDLQNAALLADPTASAAKAQLDAALARREEARQAIEANLPKSTVAPAR